MSVTSVVMGIAFNALVLCSLAVMWIATREMMQMVSKEKKMARIGLWIMRISIMLMMAPFLFIGYISGLTAMLTAFVAAIAVGILAVIMRLYLEGSAQNNVPA